MKKMNVKGARLGAKLTNIALAVVLVLGMSPASKAAAVTASSDASDLAAAENSLSGGVLSRLL
jgi:hypothetical protein